MLTAEVGDVLVVHFRNAETKVRQGITMHPHGVRYNPEYDGVFLGDFTRAGGFIGPGEEFTYTWEATPDSVGDLALPRPRAQPHAQHVPRAVRLDHRAPEGREGARTTSTCCSSTRCARDHRPARSRSSASTAAPTRATPRRSPPRSGEDVAIHVIGMDDNFHDFHIHGHRWRDPSGTFVDTPAVGPNETVTARFVEDNPGRWLYHCHVFSDQDGGMAGWYLVEP